MVSSGPETLLLADDRAGAALVRTFAGSAWRWLDSLQPDRLRAFFERSIFGDSVRLVWSPTKGLHVVTRREVQRGELIIRSRAIGFVPLNPSGVLPCRIRISQQGLQDMEALALDMATVALAISLWQEPENSAVARGLLSHVEHLTGAQRSALRRLAYELNLKSGKDEARTSAMGGSEDDELEQLLLCVRANAHLALDDETASQLTGLGIYPAAALLNHSCLPSSVISFARRGQEALVHAITPLPTGAEVTCSYLADEQLYAPWEERAAMLRAAHHFEERSLPSAGLPSSQREVRDRQKSSDKCLKERSVMALGMPTGESANIETLKQVDICLEKLNVRSI